MCSCSQRKTKQNEIATSKEGLEVYRELDEGIGWKGYPTLKVNFGIGDLDSPELKKRFRKIDDDNAMCKCGSTCED